MKHNALSIVLLLLLTGSFTFAQLPQKPSQTDIAQAPNWAQAMYQASPNVDEVDHLYKEWHRQHNFSKSYHTQYYKRWRRAVEPYVQENGSYQMPEPEELARQQAQYLAGRESATRTGANWQLVGPMRVYDSNIDFKANQSNVFSLSRSEANPNVIYAGTEPGEVYRSTNGGSEWSNVSHDFPLLQGTRAIAASPADPDVVFAGTNSYLRHSTDGGQTWTHNYLSSNFRVNEILFHPDNANIVFVAGEGGLQRSNDGGQTWASLFTDKCYDIKVNVAQHQTLYLVKQNPATSNCEFLMSTDSGLTFVPQTNGFYTSTDPDRYDGGARIAVSKSDSDRVYVYLIGEAKTGDSGFIGLYRSDDGGLNWTLPRGQVGGPYTTAVPNLAVGTDTWNYHQGFYNCALMASNSNPDEILLGGLNLWRSTDGGGTFSVVSGYRPGGPLSMHVDNQDFRAFGNEYWITTDGGIYRSSNFFQSQPEVRMNGIHSADYWGFGSGWNEDVLVGGLYHNGNASWYESWSQGNFLNLGGGENPTGYVNPGDSRRTYFSDVNGKYLPTAIGDPVTNLAFGLAPNEAYWSASSSELEWHPNCYNIAWLGRENKLWATKNGAATFEEVYTFGTDPDHDITYIEVASTNANVMYVSQMQTGTSGAVWKTTDGGSSWNSLSLPGNTNRRKILLSLDMENENHLWIAYPSGNNGQKIYETNDGGQTWTNRTSSVLDGQSPHSIFLAQGTNNGVYFCSQNSVFYLDNGTWVLYETGLPAVTSTDIARPFYRDGKIRIATYGRGIWESELHTQPSHPIARINVDHFARECDSEVFNFTDHSTLNHNGATWSWNFAGGSPAASNQMGQAVTFSGQGQHLVTLTVTDINGQNSTDTLYIDITGISNATLTEDFEMAFPPNQWRQESNGALSWSQETSTGGFGLSSTCTKADNFNINATGTWADLRAPVNLQWLAGGELTFDVAYAPYGGQYMDSLAVLVSTDCGMTFNQVYLKGGSTLATAPNQNTAFVPSATQWRTDTVDLSAYQGFDQVFVTFRNISNWGNIIYLDNVALDGTQLVGFEEEPNAGFAQIAPNPAVQGEAFKLVTDQAGEFDLNIWSTEGKLVFQTQGIVNGTQLKPVLPAGIYIYDLRGSSIWNRGKMVVVSPR